jgi:hypothetical protein
MYFYPDPVDVAETNNSNKGRMKFTKLSLRLYGRAVRILEEPQSWNTTLMDLLYLWNVVNFVQLNITRLRPFRRIHLVRI